MPVLFLQLDTNRDWWAKNGIPAPPKPPAQSRPCAGGAGLGGARVIVGEMVFQWYAGQGLQIQQLATAGRANALVKACQEINKRLACDRARVRTALDGLVTLAVDRGGFRAWEYYFAFGGGRPPWISGLAQGTAMQALARGSQVLAEPRYLEVAREGRGAFERRPPAGVRAPAEAGDHYLIYSFNPRLRVLNGFLQALVGLYDYAEIADDDKARALFRAGDRQARREVPRLGHWRVVALQRGRRGVRRRLPPLVRDFLRSLCDRTKSDPYCSTADALHRLPAPADRACASCPPGARPGACGAGALLPDEDLLRDPARDPRRPAGRHRDPRARPRGAGARLGAAARGHLRGRGRGARPGQQRHEGAPHGEGRRGDEHRRRPRPRRGRRLRRGRPGAGGRRGDGGGAGGHGGRIARDGLRVESVRLGTFTVHPAAVAALEAPADVLVVAVKAPALDAALARVRAEPGLVVPLLNGVEHVARLRERFGDRVVAATIRIAAERPRRGASCTRARCFASTSPRAGREPTPSRTSCAPPSSRRRPARPSPTSCGPS
jgi:hypothetical protein